MQGFLFFHSLHFLGNPVRQANHRTFGAFL